MSDHKPLRDSRIIRIALIGIGVMLLLQILALGVTVWLAAMASQLTQAAKPVPQLFDSIAQALSGVVGGAGIATITTAVIARYGAREATRNLSNNREGDSHA